MEGLTLANLEREILTAVTLGDFGEGRRRRRQGRGQQEEGEIGTLKIVNLQICQL